MLVLWFLVMANWRVSKVSKTLSGVYKCDKLYVHIYSYVYLNMDIHEA